jgi:HlyD family secretion protein
MMQKIIFGFFVLSLKIFSCADKKNPYDATGVFEADEIIVSAETTGKILQLNVREGDVLKKGVSVGLIDAAGIDLQKAQLQASMDALYQKQNESSPQVDMLQQQIQQQQQNVLPMKEQLRVAQIEQKRFANLVKNDAVPAKQLDDINGQIAVLQQQIVAAESQIQLFNQQIKSYKQQVDLQNRGVLSEKKPLEKRVAQLDDVLKRSAITNPIDGTVLTKYLSENEMAVVGKPIYKIAQTQSLTLRAYITGNQLTQVKVNQSVRVHAGTKDTTGVITWIASKAEFTPKTIQTVDERANLVYAVKVAVPNDGFLKMGMYGDIKF